MRRQPIKQRRALSTSRTAEPVESGGERGFARALERALARSDRDAEIAESVTHHLHAYPARMHPAMARALVEVAAGRADEPRLILDPFCGGGTVLVESRYAGFHPVGVDINPLAVSIARAKTWTVNGRRRAELAQAVDDIAGEAVAAGKAARRAAYRNERRRTPRTSNISARERSIANWFAPHVRRELEFMAAAIDMVRRDDEELGEILVVLLSSLLYKVSWRTSDTDPTRIERHVARGAAARLLRQRSDLLCAGLAEIARSSNAPVAAVHCGDARHLDRAGIDDASIDAVVTSPPYAGTYDYLDQHRLRLDFLGLSDERFSAGEIGSRRAFHGDSRTRRLARRRWQRDLGEAMAEIARVLRPGGRAAVVLGDSVAGGRAIYAEPAMKAAVGELDLLAWSRQSRPHLGAMEHEAFAERGKSEYIFLVRK